MEPAAPPLDNGNFAASADSNGGEVYDDDDRVYLVPFRWWREVGDDTSSTSSSSNGDGDDDVAPISRKILTVKPKAIPYSASLVTPYYGGPMKIINNFFSSDLVLNLKRDNDPNQDDGDINASASTGSYALLPHDLWTYAVKWHNDSKFMNSASCGDETADVYPLMLRISITGDDLMTIKITKKDNTDNYKRACKIFCVESETARIWDFSGRTSLIFMNEWNKMPRDCQRQVDQEVLLQLQVHGLSENTACKSESKKEDSVVQHSIFRRFSSGNLLATNGTIGNADSDIQQSRGPKRVSSLGLIGLENLGNTCFMNSAIQCLAHTTPLVDYFLGDYNKEINHHNPLGMDGELALAFGELLRKLWAPDTMTVVPRVFKGKLSRFAPQFSGFNQHDSQELLAFLLDGLHEDLNRVKSKPYIEAKDASDRPDEEVADEYWANHLARNDSIIVDFFQGQYRSKLVCPVCHKVSITFDPFMYVSLPLPSTSLRAMTVTVFSSDGTTKPSSFTVNVPKLGTSKDLIQALSIACSLKDDESLVIAEVFSNRIIHFLEDPSHSLSLIRDGDRLAAYRLPKDSEKFVLVLFMHQHLQEHYTFGKMEKCWKPFNVPLIGMLPRTSNGSMICKLFLKLLRPFVFSNGTTDIQQDDNKYSNVGEGIADVDVARVGLETADGQGKDDDNMEEEHVQDDLKFYLTDDKGLKMLSKIETNQPFVLADSDKLLRVLVCWEEEAMKQYDMTLFSTIPEVLKSGFLIRRPQYSVSLYACLEAFLKEEPLGPEDMWYCPSCKKHQQASKKLDLWRLAEVLVIHLKRFSYSRFTKNKLDTFVDFPIHDLDLSAYVAHNLKQPSDGYMLYGVINHYGNMGGGHYTAYAFHEETNRWYDFDDRHVSPITEDSVKTSAAYVLFYKRVKRTADTPNSD